MITIRSLGDQVHDELVSRILDGRIGPGARLRDADLAASLGVSRTPVREALRRLARDGVVEADHNRGFRVRPLSAQEVRDSYPILWALESLALRISEPAPPHLIAQLDQLNHSLEAAQEDPDASMKLDDQWHALLLCLCPNIRLLEMIRSLKASLRRYESAYMRQVGRVPDSVRQHEAVLHYLRQGSHSEAAQALEANWHDGMVTLLRWLDADHRSISE